MKRTMCVWFPNWPVQRVLAEGTNPRETQGFARDAAPPHPNPLPPEYRGERGIVLYAPVARGLAVTACSTSAAQTGVRPGMPLAEAEALLPEGRFVKHDRAADTIALQKLANDCMRYTPVVAVEEGETPECLLLDVTGSAHLFGGERKLAEKTAADLRGYAVRIGIADGIGAAWAIAHSETRCRAAAGALEPADVRRAGGVSPPRDGVPAEPTGLASDALPRGAYAPRSPASEPAIIPPGQNPEIVPNLGVAVLRLAPDVVALLHQFDLWRVSQLMALPRGEVALRFGHETLTRLDQALGVLPEVIVPERHVEPVRAAWTFEDPVACPQVIENVIERLISQIVATLTPRQVGVQRLLCTLTTVDKGRTEFAVGLLHPSLSVERLVGLTRLRWETVRLPAAVASVKLRAKVAPLDVRQPRWFESEGDARREASFRDFVERLSSRLGEEAVVQPRLRAEEQPEYAWEYVPWLRRKTTSIDAIESEALAYPIDLLSSPLGVHVETAGERPCRFAWRQRVYDIARSWGPQRIETGWWRGHDVRRDYYRVEAAGGERFWLFRDRSRGTWFLHGVFA